jgi:TolB-like protein/flavin-binding protein dodecin
MNMIRLIQILIGLVLFFSFTLTGHSFSQGKIVFKEVLVTGIGQSQEEAVNNALAEAISSVNGKNVQTQTIIKIMGGEEIPDKFYQRQKENKDRDAQRQKENKDRDAQTARIEIVGKTLENLARIIKGQPEKANETKDKKTSSDESPQYTQSYIKKLVDETKGGIKTYQILEKKKNEQGWIEVKIKAEVASFELPPEASRVRIAVFPFKVFNAQGDKEKLQRLINQEVNNYFVQTRKFAILDRSYLEEVAKEKSKILDGSAPAIEMAKIGNEISADFIIVGSVEDFKTEKTVTKVLTDESTKITRESAILNLNYRVLDVTTKQISNSDTIKLKISSKGGPNEAMSEVALKAARNMGEEVLFSIYPVLVEKIDGPDLYLGQGGKQFKTGDIYEVFEKGDKIYDSYTKEAIGNIESPRGKVQITSVSSNMSKARSTEKGINFADNFTPGKYILRPVKVDVKAAEEAVFKETKEKIDTQRKERKKKLDDEM